MKTNSFIFPLLAVALGGMCMIATPSAIASPSGTIDAAEIKVKVYKFAVSTSPQCTAPVTIFNSDLGVEQDLMASPTFGTGHVDPGTYPCVILEISKIIKTSASVTSGACTAGVEFPDVICSDSGQPSQLVDGTPVTCTGSAATDQKVALYLTTLAAGIGGDRGLMPPSSATDSGSGLRLTSPFVVTSDTTGTLTVDYHNFLGSDLGAGICYTNPPSFGFE